MSITPTLVEPTLAQPSASSVASAKRAASFYRLKFGWNALPSHRREKRPMIPFYGYWNSLIDESFIQRWEQWNTPNVQLMCGVRWGLAVIDLDGIEGWERWTDLGRTLLVPRTWLVKTGGGSSHLYFTVPSGVTELPTATLWKEPGCHSEIRLLADRSLVIAPPSHHVTTGLRYEWIIGAYDMPRPAELPMWVIEMAMATVERPQADPNSNRSCLPAPHYAGSRTYDRDTVIAALTPATKLGLVRDWGLRLTGRVTRRGWWECHAVDRQDDRPSAGFEPTAGIYNEPFARTLSFFDLAVALGAFGTWQDACNTIGATVGA